jgi:hypothetical protein
MQITDEMIDAFGMAFWPVNAATKIDEQQEEIRAALAAALSSAHPAPAQEVEIRPLEWSRNEMGTWYAASAVGTYLVNQGRWWRKDRTPLIDVGDDELAKAAAQHDYESRIRSAIVSPARAATDIQIETSIDTMREEALRYVKRLGWTHNSKFSLHSVVELLAAFGKQASDGMFGCGYPECGCCHDAACEDAIKQHPDFAPPATDKLALARKALIPTKCTSCDGKGGFEDTTYDRTGAWVSCNLCQGAGETYDMRSVKKVRVALSTIEESDHA